MREVVRCKLCALPLTEPGPTGYCSERCLLWDFFGAPALKEDALIDEILANQRRRTAPEDWTPPAAYPALKAFRVWREAEPILIESLALIQRAPTHAQ